MVRPDGAITIHVAEERDDDAIGDPTKELRRLI
jgi:hypothetical protein